jgi:hypothetical protein
MTRQNKKIRREKRKLKKNKRRGFVGAKATTPSILIGIPVGNDHKIDCSGFGSVVIKIRNP